MTEVGSPGEHGAQQRDDFSEKLLFLEDFFLYAHRGRDTDQTLAMPENLGETGAQSHASWIQS